MKKLLAILCALCLAFSLAACGGGASSVDEAKEKELDEYAAKVSATAKVEDEATKGQIRDVLKKLQSDGYTDLEVTSSILAGLAAIQLDADWYTFMKAVLDLGEGDMERSNQIVKGAMAYIIILERPAEDAVAELQQDAQNKGQAPAEYAQWVAQDVNGWALEKSGLASAQQAPQESAAPAEPVEIYADDRVTISFVSIDAPKVKFLVENKTDATITIQADAIAFDGKSAADIIMSDDVAPQSKGYVTAKCKDAAWSAAAVTSGQLRVIDFDKSFETYTATWVEVPVSDQEPAPAPMGRTILYQDDKVRIAFNSLGDGAAHRRGVVFDVENLTDVCITIQADAVSVNGFSYNDLVMSDNVAPRSIGTVVAKCDQVDAAETVETIGGSLRVIDFDKSFSSYKAAFTNIPLVGPDAAGEAAPE